MVHWFEEPFALVPTPLAKLPEGEKPDVFNDVATGKGASTTPLDDWFRH